MILTIKSLVIHKTVVNYQLFILEENRISNEVCRLLLASVVCVIEPILGIVVCVVGPILGIVVCIVGPLLGIGGLC